MTSAGRLPVPVELIERRIYLVRGFKVMLDSDLAELYQVPTKVLNQAVRRNSERFPKDFMFQLTKKESSGLRSHFVKLREVLATHKDLAIRLEQMEAAQREHGSILVAVVEEIKRLKQGPRRPKRNIGFYTAGSGAV